MLEMSPAYGKGSFCLAGGVTAVTAGSGDKLNQLSELDFVLHAASLDVSHLTPPQSHSLCHANICRPGVQDIQAKGQTAQKLE